MWKPCDYVNQGVAILLTTIPAWPGCSWSQGCLGERFAQLLCDLQALWMPCRGLGASKAQQPEALVTLKASLALMASSGRKLRLRYPSFLIPAQI